MIVKKIIEKIEGEAEVKYSFKNGAINDATINFANNRGIEEILKNRPPRDSLVITPRVCGICNHAHLIAAVKALEDGLKKNKIDFELTNKAKDIRDFTLFCELIQNHIKWLYLTIYPELFKLLNLKLNDSYALKASYVTNTITKAMAIFSGQWPHSSYAVIGGVSCDPTFIDIMQATSLIDEVITFFEKVLLGLDLEEYLEINSITNLDKLKGDFSEILYLIGKNNLATIGKSYDRFITLSDSKISKKSKVIITTKSDIELKFVKEHMQQNSQSKAVTYKNRFYETGPLARAMSIKEPIIKSMHKKYKDSLITRVYARVHEAVKLIKLAKDILVNLNINQDSCVIDSKIKLGDIEGIGTVEASRGSLIHKIKTKRCLIESYQIIVPTQWNLSNSLNEQRGVAIKAMIGLKDINKASLVFKSFDVCSVCTVK